MSPKSESDYNFTNNKNENGRLHVSYFVVIKRGEMKQIEKEKQ